MVHEADREHRSALVATEYDPLDLTRFLWPQLPVCHLQTNLLVARTKLAPAHVQLYRESIHV